MADEYPALPDEIRAPLRRGVVIPAHPLALTRERKLDERRQRALSRYYLDAGAGGLAVGVHTTEFAIHDPSVGLYRPVLELARGVVQRRADTTPAGGVPIMVAGVIGPTAQAVREAGLARELGYHLALVGLGALKEASDDELVDHLRQVARVLPVMGFYLQPAVGGRILTESFWRRAAEIPNLAAIKIAPFNRYYTLAVVRAVAEAGRLGEVALYTGNDDQILLDLLTRWELDAGGRTARAEIVGGLLGHWAFWTRRAVEHLETAREYRGAESLPTRLLTLAAQITESNEAAFDPEHDFRGSIAGILYILTKSGLLEGVYPLGEAERLSPGQARKIDRVIERYPHLTDHAFVRENLDRWLSE